MVDHDEHLSCTIYTLLKVGIMMNIGMHQPEHLCDVTSVQQTVVGANLADAVASTDDLRLIEQLRKW